MWRNYFTVGVRALVKNKTYAFINIAGLAIGLAACLLLLVYVRYETSYDAWLPGAENAYQLQILGSDPETGEDRSLQQTQFVAGAALAKDFPQVAAKVYVAPSRVVALKAGEPIALEDGLAADGPFFDVLPLPLLRGDPRTALAAPGNVVLSQDAAAKLFGTADPLGRTLTLIENGRRVDHPVTGVMRDIPRNSHLRASLIRRFNPAVDFAAFPEYVTSWGQISGWNYVRLKPGSTAGDIHRAMPQWERRNIPPPVQDGAPDIREMGDWRLVNVRDVHLGAVRQGGMTPSNDRRTIATFLVIALLILGMAMVNFTNLTTARASQRAREVALRKVLGARRAQLVLQFVGESVLVAACAMLLALAAVELLLPLLSDYLEADLRLHYFGSGGMALPIAALTLVAGAAGGLYPAFYLSRARPGQILKANRSAAEPESVGLFRSVLVIAQFAVSIGLIACTAIVYAQTLYARTADPGFRREGILQISGIAREAIVPLQKPMMRRIAAVDGVASVARTGIAVDTPNDISREVYLPGRRQPANIGNYAVDESFFATMGIDLLAGRAFDERRPADRFESPYLNADPELQRALVARGANVVVNAGAARLLGWRDPADAVGKTVRIAQFMDPAAGLVPATIVGVVADTRFRSMRRAIEPIVYRLATDTASHMVVRYDTSRPGEVVERIGRIWKQMVPDSPFEARFSEDIVGELYEAEQARSEIFAFFALLAMVIACLGLFGLAAFAAERRTREIGIRKVFGARVRDIVQLLAWQFTKPVILANLVAAPIAWWAMRDWLNQYDERIALTPGPFLFAGLLALGLALATIAGHAIRVARANPMHALRYE